MDSLNISNLFLVVKFDDDDKGDYWAVPFTSVDTYLNWVDIWRTEGGIKSMADNVCVVFNGVGDVPLDLSKDPLGTRKCPKCTRRPKCCLRSAKVVYGPRENLCCVLVSYERRVTGYDSEDNETVASPPNEQQEADENQQSCLQGKQNQNKAAKKREDFQKLCDSYSISSLAKYDPDYERLFSSIYQSDSED